MTEFEREEVALRKAFDRKAAAVPITVPPLRATGRPWLSFVLVAAAVLVVIGGTLAVVGRDDGRRAEPTPAGYWNGRVTQWLSFRDIEVMAPAGWPVAYEAVRPDCIAVRPDGSVLDTRWSADVPRKPYVSFGTSGGVVDAIGCIRRRTERDPDPAFGDVPYSLWQPHVRIVAARPDSEAPDDQDADVRYRGWHLTRTTTHGVQITVLSAPGDDELATGVLGSLRVVTTNHLGCRVESTVLSHPATVPNRGPLPDPDAVSSVSVCEYQTGPSGQGLGPSRQIIGAPARELVGAIADAPAGRGPGSGRNCRHGRSQRALVLAFFGADGRPTRPLATARVYFDSCADNGIVGAGGEHALTRGDCAPLFASPPIGLWSGSVGVYPLCYTAVPVPE